MENTEIADPDVLVLVLLLQFFTDEEDQFLFRMSRSAGFAVFSIHFKPRIENLANYVMQLNAPEGVLSSMVVFYA